MIGESIKYSSLAGFDRNISRFGLQSNVVQVVKTSSKAFDEWRKNYPLNQKYVKSNIYERYIRLLFVDGWHTYDAVFHDIMSWGQYVSENGIIAVHDYKQEQIKNAVNDAMKLLEAYDFTYIDENMISFKKPFISENEKKRIIKEILEAEKQLADIKLNQKGDNQTTEGKNSILEGDKPEGETK